MALPTSGATGVARTLPLDQRLQRRRRRLDRRAPRARRGADRSTPSPALPAFRSSASQSPRRLPTFAAGEPLVEHLAGQEVGLHELAERATDLILAMRDDRRVRDGDAEWMPEQRRHGEPVGQRAHHRGLGERSHVADPAVVLLLPSGNEEDDRDEQGAVPWRRASSCAARGAARDRRPTGRPSRRRYQGLQQPIGTTTRSTADGPDQTAVINSAMPGLVRSLRMMRSR